jgi:acetyltransferase-like isoleucine patch superfamily enzyme
MWGMPVLTGGTGLEHRLHVGQDCWFNAGCRLDLSDTITIGDRAALGHEVLIMTSSHELGDQARRAGPLYTRPVSIGAGAWLGARCMILPGVTIGEGAVVAAGALVNRDVPPNTLVGGVPARMLKVLPC